MTTKKEKQPKERQRKEYKHGTITQKMLSFKLDLDLFARLKQEPNKGRLINNLIREHYKLNDLPYDEDEDPAEHDIENYLN